MELEGPELGTQGREELRVGSLAWVGVDEGSQAMQILRRLLCYPSGKLSVPVQARRRERVKDNWSVRPDSSGRPNNIFFKNISFCLFIFGCAESLLCGLFSSCSEQAFHCGGSSCCRAQHLGCLAFSSSGSWAQLLWFLGSRAQAQ